MSLTVRNLSAAEAGAMRENAGVANGGGNKNVPNGSITDSQKTSLTTFGQNRASRAGGGEQKITKAGARKSGTSTGGKIKPVRSLPPLPAYRDVDLATYVGPTDESNWVLPGILMAGAFPASNNDSQHDQIISSILSLGISTFVCLQAEYEHDPNIPPHMWQNGYKIRPYIFDAMRMLKEGEKDATKKRGPRVVHSSKLDFIHVPIVDCSTTNDDTVLNLSRDIV